MKRWDGWGDDTIIYPLPDRPRRFLERLVGPGTPPRDATLEEVISMVPPSRLPDHPLVSGDPAERVRHARGQSLPDWIALRSGHILAFPDGVALPFHRRRDPQPDSLCQSGGRPDHPLRGWDQCSGPHQSLA